MSSAHCEPVQPAHVNPTWFGSSKKSQFSVGDRHTIKINSIDLVKKELGALGKTSSHKVMLSWPINDE